jgi:hypothetical protein
VETTLERCLAIVAKQFISEDAVIAPNENVVFMPMDASGKIRTQDMLKLTPMKLDARRAFIKSLGQVRRYLINTLWRIFFLKHIRKGPVRYREYAMWMQKRKERYRKNL